MAIICSFVPDLTFPAGTTAKKYPPTDAADFAKKYVSGAFTFVSDIDKIRDYAKKRVGEHPADVELHSALDEGHAPLLSHPEVVLGTEESHHPIDILMSIFPDIDEESILYVFNATDGDLEQVGIKNPGIYFFSNGFMA